VSKNKKLGLEGAKIEKKRIFFKKIEKKCP
jgi:hypothetical protein